MAVPKKLTSSGGVTLGPIQPTCSPFPSADCVASLAAMLTTEADITIARQINSPAVYVDLLAGTGITNVKAFLLRVTGGTLDVRRTSPLAVDQEDRVSDLMLVINPISGSEWTALAVRGTAALEAIIAGS